MKALLALLTLLVFSPPESDGWSTLACGGEDVRIFRDSWGIPHIFAKTTHGLFWAQGYAECEYTLTQLRQA